MTAPDLADLLLPTGTRLVHIGPPKTGTTSVQGAMWASRDELRRQGVRYAGRGRHPAAAARSVVGSRSPTSRDGSPPSIRHWERIVRDIQAAPEPRTLLSSELLAHGNAAAVRRIADDLDPARMHVAVTLRPLPRMLASLWQQGVQAGSVAGFDPWLESHLGREGAVPEHRLWHVHRHDELIARWASVVGPERVTAIVIDERDHAMVLRVFEALLGIRPGTLQLQEDYQNRSLVLDEAETIRALSIRLRDMGVSAADRTFLVRNGAARVMKLRVPRPDEPKVVAPAWALERAGMMAAGAVDAIRASGVRVIGDLDRLLVVPEGPESLPPWDGRLSAEAAVGMAVGTVTGSGVMQAAGYLGTTRALDREPILPMLSDRTLLRLLVRRRRARAIGALRARLGLGAE